MSTRKLILNYTLLFGITAFLVFLWFFLTGRTLIWHVDGEEYPIIAADIKYMGLDLPAGSHHVTLTYKTPFLQCRRNDFSRRYHNPRSSLYR